MPLDIQLRNSRSSKLIISNFLLTVLNARIALPENVHNKYTFLNIIKHAMALEQLQIKQQ